MSRANLPRRRRAPIQQLPGFRLTERDIGIVETTCEYRVVDARIIDLLWFPRSEHMVIVGENYSISSRCHQRLQMLYHHRLLDRYRRVTDGSFLYVLDTAGRDRLAERRGVTVDQLDWRPRDNRLAQQAPHTEHILAVNYVRAALEVSTAKHSLAVANWRDDLSYRRSPIPVNPATTGEAGSARLIPDGGFYLVRESTKSVWPFYMELDRGTQVIRAADAGVNDWVGKVETYFALALERGLRVLAVTTAGKGRLENLQQAAEEAGASSVFYFTLWEQARHPALVLSEPIWRGGSGRVFRLLDLCQG